MPNNLKLEFKNNLSDLSNGLDAALSWLTPFNLPPDASYVTILALEELATHAINHGYPDNLEHLIHVEITVEKNQLVIQYLDDGVFFNPLDVQEPDTNLPIEDRPTEGLGILLLRKISDDMTYERKGGNNFVTVYKGTSS
jgi:anti-sigma regulatory factor (Ser/Thr protein kinase)